MVTVVGHIGCQMETGQQRLGITDVDMVNPPSSLVSGSCHKLLEAKIAEGCEQETVGMLVQADVEVPRDSCQPLHVDQLLQIVHQIFLASIG